MLAGTRYYANVSLNINSFIILIMSSPTRIGNMRITTAEHSICDILGRKI